MEAVAEKIADALRQIPTLKDLQGAKIEQFPGCNVSRHVFESDILETDNSIKFRVLSLDAPKLRGALPAGIYLETSIEYVIDRDIDPSITGSLSKRMAKQLSKTRVIEEDLKLSPFGYTEKYHYLVFSLTPAQQG